MVLSDIPAHRQILSEAGEAGQLFGVDNPASLAKAIDHWLAAPPSVLQRARAAAFQLGQERWNWEEEQYRLLRVLANHKGCK